MLSRRDLCRDFDQVQVHRLGVAGWQDQRCAFALLGADCAEDIGRSSSLIVGGRWARATLGPSPRDLVLLADARLIRKPDF